MAQHMCSLSMLSASRFEMLGATLYLYGREGDTVVLSEPCPICMRMIRNAGIKKVEVLGKTIEME